MYPDQKIRIISPLLDWQLKELNNDLSTVYGDSLLLVNIALLYSQKIMYFSDDQIRLLAISTGDAVTIDMLYHYSTLNTGTPQQIREKLATQIYVFIIEVSKFFLNSPLLKSLFEELKNKNLYISADRVNDDAQPPYIDVNIHRG